MRWRSLLVFGLRMCELEVMEGTMGHFLVSLPSSSILWRFTIMGVLLSYSIKKKKPILCFLFGINIIFLKYSGYPKNFELEILTIKICRQKYISVFSS